MFMDVHGISGIVFGRLVGPGVCLLPRKGGGLEDEGKDHFPQMSFRPKVALEHLV